jgi:hypothetical protein
MFFVFLLGGIAGGWLEFYYLVGWKSFWSTFQGWQTLIGSLGAIGVAIWTVSKISQQVGMQKKIAEAESERHRDSAIRRTMSLRAQLPDALAAIASYLEECGRYIAFSAGGKEVTLPDQPKEEIDIIKTALEYMDKDTTQVMMELVIHYQVHNARLELLEEDFVEHSPVAETSSVAERMYDLVKLSHMVGQLFPFARLSVEVAVWEPPTKEQVLELGREFFHDFLDLEEVPTNGGSKSLSD